MIADDVLNIVLDIVVVVATVFIIFGIVGISYRSMRLWGWALLILGGILFSSGLITWAFKEHC